MTKIKKKIKLKKDAKKLIAKIVITLLIAIADIILYHYLGVLGAYVGETAWANSFILVGWFWLLGAQFIVLYAMWE